MNHLRRALAFLAACSFLNAPAAFCAEEERLPAGYRFVGNFKLEKRVKIRNGAPLAVVSKPFICRVYTDGIAVRIYGDDGSEGHTAFTIYRNDGVMVATGGNVLETVPGIQAQTLVGNVLRQLTLTQKRLVLTKFPALSDVVEVTYANRLVTVTRIEQP